VYDAAPVTLHEISTVFISGTNLITTAFRILPYSQFTYSLPTAFLFCRTDYINTRELR